MSLLQNNNASLNIRKDYWIIIEVIKETTVFRYHQSFRKNVIRC